MANYYDPRTKKRGIAGDYGKRLYSRCEPTYWPGVDESDKETDGAETGKTEDRTAPGSHSGWFIVFFFGTTASASSFAFSSSQFYFSFVSLPSTQNLSRTVGEEKEDDEKNKALGILLVVTSLLFRHQNTKPIDQSVSSRMMKKKHQVIWWQ